MILLGHTLKLSAMSQEKKVHGVASSVYPSIHSFYKREVLIPISGEPSVKRNPTKVGDGFTVEELADARQAREKKRRYG